MSRLRRCVGVILLTSALGLGMSAGPVMADDTGGPPPATTVAPATPAPDIPAPTTSVPAEQPTTQPTPVPDPPTPAQPADPGQPTTTTEPPKPEVTPPEPAPSEQPTPAPDPSASEKDKADLQVSVWFGMSSYMRDEVISAYARMTNAGTAPATQATLTSTGNLRSHDWSPSFPTGTLVEPGQTLDFYLSGQPTTAEDEVRLIVTAQDLSGQEDANPADNTVTMAVPITSGSFRGTVYGDRDGNGAMEPGEALAGVTVTLSKWYPHPLRTTVTDSSGRFAFLDLPRDSYSVWFSSADWYIRDRNEYIDGVDDPDLLFRGLPVVGSALSISARFTQSTYQLNDLAHVVVTVTNNGTYPLLGLTAYCSATGSPEVDTGAFSGAGLAVPAGATRTVDITFRVNDGAFNDGYITSYIHVGAPPGHNGQASAQVTARVPRGMAPRVVGYLNLFRGKPMLGRPYGDPLPDVKVYLRNPATRQIVARAVTENDGRFTFFNLPVDHYELGVVGPWWVYWPSTDFPVRHGETGSSWEQWHYIFVMRGPDQPDPDPEQPPAGQPTPTPPPGPGDVAPQTKETGLAWTGANVLWLAVGGLIAVTAGAGLILHGRKRRAG